jgi:DNA-binding MarR family transcriptional regulator
MSTTMSFGQQLAFAGRNLTKGLHATLARHDMEPATWYALITLSTYGPMPVERLQEELAQAPAVASIDELANEGLIGVIDGNAALTDAGRERFEHVREAVQARTKELLGRFEPADIEATRRVLGALADAA